MRTLVGLLGLVCYVCAASLDEETTTRSVDDIAGEKARSLVLALDSDKNGDVSVEEFYVLSVLPMALIQQQLQFEDKEMTLLMHHYDTDKDGKWSEQELSFVFNIIDVDKDGVLSTAEVTTHAKNLLMEKNEHAETDSSSSEEEKE